MKSQKITIYLGTPNLQNHIRYVNANEFWFNLCMYVSTYFRSTAMAVTLAVARLGAILGNVIFGYFIELSCAVPILMVAVLLISGGLLSIKLPSTSRTALA